MNAFKTIWHAATGALLLLAATAPLKAQTNPGLECAGVTAGAQTRLATYRGPDGVFWGLLQRH